MEVLLAALIVGVIGLALGAITATATREGGVGRTRSILRNQLSLAVRQMRHDIAQANTVTFPGTPASGGGVVLLRLETNEKRAAGPDGDQLSVVEYIYKRGTLTGFGTNAKTGGSLIRKAQMVSNSATNRQLLSNVKDISSSDGKFQSPSFTLLTNAGDNGAIESRLRMQLIVEMPTRPVVNETVEEIFELPHGFGISSNL